MVFKHIVFFCAAGLLTLSVDAGEFANEPVMLAIPAGKYLMGDINGTGESNEKPVHEVVIKAFKMSKYEITYEQFDAFADATERPRPVPVPEFDVGRGKHPVNRISWQDAVDYTAWLSAQTGKKYRLPSEAEWQYAARAGTATDYYWGNDPATRHSNTGLTWGKPSVGGDDKWLSYAPVGQFPANPWGLHDMHGNVWEWVMDCYHETYADAPADGSAWMTGDCKKHVQLGNSFHNGPTPVSTRGASAGKNPTVGFRIAEDY